MSVKCLSVWVSVRCQREQISSILLRCLVSLLYNLCLKFCRFSTLKVNCENNIIVNEARLLVTFIAYNNTTITITLHSRQKHSQISTTHQREDRTCDSDCKYMMDIYHNILHGRQTISYYDLVPYIVSLNQVQLWSKVSMYRGVTEADI